MNTIAWAVIVIAAALTAYVWLAYPALLRLVSSPRPHAPNDADEPLPQTAIIIAAHNAASVIRQTLTSLLRADCPRDRRVVYVVSDASRDDTARIVRSFRNDGVHLIDSRTRRGKTGAENLVLPRIDAEVVVFMDANVQITPGALRALVQEFRDPQVGVVSGVDQARAQRGTVGVGESAYTRLEMRIRRRESDWSGLVGASGCFYAARRELFREALPPMLTRDFASVLLARRRGLRAVVAEDACCQVSTSSVSRVEFRRKVRTIMQGLATLMHYRGLMNPLRYGRFAIALISHKLLRWMAQPLLILALVGGLYLFVSNVQGAATLAIAGVLALGALLSCVRFKWMKFAQYVALVSVATLVAWGSYLSGRRVAIWHPTPRGQTSARFAVRLH